MAIGGSSKNLAGRLALAKLSDDIFTNEDARHAFVADPDAFITREYGLAPGDDDSEFIHRLRDMVADGCCCHGCGCHGIDLSERVINAAIRQPFQR